MDPAPPAEHPHAHAKSNSVERRDKGPVRDTTAAYKVPASDDSLKPERNRDDVRGTVILVTRHDPTELHYLRVTIVSGDDDVAMTLYEVDGRGWVHRQFQMRGDETRFAPEDILMCRPVNLRAMRSHPCTEVMEAEEFELLWGEVAGERSFAARLPDARLAWEGSVGDGCMRVRWQPYGAHAPGWTEVPGFLDLYVRGDARAARRACTALFLEQPISWRALAGEVRADRVFLTAAA